MYLILCTLHLTFRSEGLSKASKISKAFLMPVLLLYFLSRQTEGLQGSLLVILALGLDSLGDILLIESNKGNRFFLGMDSFFLGHICYGTYLALHGIHWVYFFIAIGLLAYPLYKILRIVQVPPYGLPLGIYATLLSMLIAFSAGSGSLYCTLGAVAFAFSDYFIAMEAIGKRIFSETSIMATYTLAQLLLIIGILSLQGVW